MKTIDDALELLRARARDLRTIAARGPFGHLSEGAKIALKQAEELGRIANEIDRRAKQARKIEPHGCPNRRAQGER